MKLYTAQELLKKFKGKYIQVYPHHYERKDKRGNWITVYEVVSVKNKVWENHQTPEEVVFG